ncbi:MAG TPA: hypothetical protein VG010_00505 [Solirubrobacteraceae bacterium]|nr:hypothetical protein [Solirubrobacteraceae bacterium]
MPAPPSTPAARAPRELARTYAGIGSRRTPGAVLELIEGLASGMAGEEWVLRTGLSPGADQAFYRGALRGGGRVELYLPWPGFEAPARLPGDSASVSVFEQPSEAACELAARYHPDFELLPRAQRLLLARDCHQVLGPDLTTPAELVVCWTADGSVDGGSLHEDGTGQALRVAHDRGVPVRNLARPGHLREVTES